jgi:antitoxin component YwqK of YwqJK toxin-antitoxin module
MKPLLIIILFFFSLTDFGQKTPIDSGFTDSTEARNLYVNGLKDGKWVEYDYDNELYTNGPTAYVLTIYKNGKPEGVVNRYSMHSDHSLIARTIYKNGEKNGTEKAYYYSGKLSLEGNYINGKLDGDYKSYNLLDGELEMELKYLNGRVLMKKVYYHNGSGKVSYEEQYDKSGKLLERKEFYPDGSQKK